MKSYFPLYTSLMVSIAAMPALAQTNRGNLSVGTEINGASITGNATTTTSATAAVSGAMKDGAPLQKGATSSTMMGWTQENEYWRNEYISRPYYKSDTSYSIYEPAYQFGFDNYLQYGGKPYDSLDANQLKSQWERSHGTSSLSWEQARPAVRDAYEHMLNSRAETTTSTSIK